MRTPKLTAFSPRLVQVWIDAATRPVRLPCDSKAEAVKLRHRLYKLRQALEAENHSAYQSAQYATIRLQEYEPAKFEVIVEPADVEFDHILDRAGISEPEMPDLPDINFDD